MMARPSKAHFNYESTSSRPGRLHVPGFYSCCRCNKLWLPRQTFSASKFHMIRSTKQRKNTAGPSPAVSVRLQSCWWKGTCLTHHASLNFEFRIPKSSFRIRLLLSACALWLLFRCLLALQKCPRHTRRRPRSSCGSLRRCPGFRSRSFEPFLCPALSECHRT